MTRRRQEFPLLRDFFRGYLHQDLAEEHGTARAAALAYVVALSPQEREKVAGESSRLSKKLRHASLETANQQLIALGSAWICNSLSELQEVLLTLQIAE